MLNKILFVLNKMLLVSNKMQGVYRTLKTLDFFIILKNIEFFYNLEKH